jgi:two-component system, sensor histidine kinase PdtaS
MTPITGLPLRSILTVPLWARQQVIGVIQVVDAQVGRFNQTDLTLLESLAATAAIAVENARLYEQARQDAETKAALLNEVNHRVKNNMAAIIGLLYAEQRHVGLADQPVYQEIMTNLVNRVQGLATVHSMLSASQWAPVSLAELVRLVVRSSLQALPSYKQIMVNVTHSTVQVTPNQAHNLALIINELTTNTIRHAMLNRQQAQITVNIQPEADRIWLEFKDDGPGYPEHVLRLERHGVGFDLIAPLVHKGLQGELSLQNDPGATTIITFTNLTVNGEKPL